MRLWDSMSASKQYWTVYRLVRDLQPNADLSAIQAEIIKRFGVKVKRRWLMARLNKFCTVPDPHSHRCVLRSEFVINTEGATVRHWFTTAEGKTMSKKTNILLRVFSHHGDAYNAQPHYRVKIDSKGFPYIVWGNEKVIVRRTDFPYETDIIYGLHRVTVDCIEGLEELKQILSDPELTVDRLSAQQLGKMT